jgi:preprotein translocase subunit SecY
MNPLLHFFTIKELRKKFYFTLGVLVIYRIGVFLPIPGINPTALKNYFESQQGQGLSMMDYFDFFSGGAFSNFSIFMLSIAPYISMSIVMQIFLFGFPEFKRWQEEEGGRKKINRYTRYGTVVVALVQSYLVSLYARSIPGVVTIPFNTYVVVAMLTVTTGTMFLMWMGEQINQRGIGNGISLLIFVGIISRLPEAVFRLIQGIQSPIENINPVFVLILLVIFVAVVVLVICEQMGQRRIEVQYARRMAGAIGEKNTYIPIKLNPAGVIPVIFASTILTFPMQIMETLASEKEWVRQLLFWLSPNGATYNIITVLLIVLFTYFYAKLQINPTDVAKHIREGGATIVDLPEGMSMETYLGRTLNRLLLPGSLFLAFIAIIPFLLQMIFSFPPQVTQLIGGTSLLILVGVDLDTLSQMEAHVKMYSRTGMVESRKGFSNRI